MKPLRQSLACLLLVLTACTHPSNEPSPLAASVNLLSDSAANADLTRSACQQAIGKTLAVSAASGTPELDRRRVEVLGRALAEPVIFVAEPASAKGLPEHRSFASADATSTRAIVAISRLRGRNRHDRPALRSKVLRDGYLYSDAPYEAFALVRVLTLSDLFDEPHVWLQRGGQTLKLTREKYLRRSYRYVHTDGPQRGLPAKLLLFDRVALQKDKLATPLHRDVRGLRDALGFDRMTVEHLTTGDVVAKLRFGDRWLRALLAARGPKLSLQCLDASKEDRAWLKNHQRKTKKHRDAVKQLQATMAQLVAERLPFDRPRGAEDHFSDGQLRPRWRWAYKNGQRSFQHEEKTYRVFDADGRPHPPQMCVEMIVDGIERASGTWYAPQSQKRQRAAGGIDFNQLGIGNRAGVIAFETYAKAHPELFDAKRIPSKQRVPFARRKRYFQYLSEHADDFAAADIVAIQGRKRDGYIHQHAILIEDIDPITGFAYALMDHMKLPRRRTWEMIMAEAPQRSLLYHLRMQEPLLTRMAPAEKNSSEPKLAHGG